MNRKPLPRNAPFRANKIRLIEAAIQYSKMNVYEETCSKLVQKPCQSSAPSARDEWPVRRVRVSTAAISPACIRPDECLPGTRRFFTQSPYGASSLRHVAPDDFLKRFRGRESLIILVFPGRKSSSSPPSSDPLVWSGVASRRFEGARGRMRAKNTEICEGVEKVKHKRGEKYNGSVTSLGSLFSFRYFCWVLSAINVFSLVLFLKLVSSVKINELINNFAKL